MKRFPGKAKDNNRSLCYNFSHSSSVDLQIPFNGLRSQKTFTVQMFRRENVQFILHFPNNFDIFATKVKIVGKVQNKLRNFSPVNVIAE